MNDAILLLDPDAATRRLLSALLRRQGYQVLQAGTLEEGVDVLRRFQVAAVLLELELPDHQGPDVVERIRAQSTASVLVLSNRHAEHDKVRALDLGARDYIVKPFRHGELLARLRVALRSSRGIRREAGLEVGDLQVYPTERRVYVRGAEVALTPTEFSLLHVMARRAGTVVTHRQLLDNVWGSAKTNEASYLRVFVYQLRKKLEQNPDAPQLLLTAPGVGYRLKIPA
jgi:two-component system KDP operon response regulator KdpE